MQKNLISTVLNDTLRSLESSAHPLCMHVFKRPQTFIDHFCRDEGHHWALVTL